MAGEGVPPAAGVAAQVTLEGLLARVELDVAQQVALLGERGAALVALERTLTCGQEHSTSASLHKDADKSQSWLQPTEALMNQAVRDLMVFFSWSH